MKLGITALRIIVGSLFTGHGLQKLTGAFKGHGLEATGKSFESMGLRPGRPHATAAAVSETAGGALLCAGLLTPFGASMVTGSMAVAIRKVHFKNGIWVTEGGFEYNLVLAAAAFAIVSEGPGPLSLDRALGLRLSGPGAAIVELAAALAGATLVVSRAERLEQAAQATPSPRGANGASADVEPQPAQA
jgi:putative oxidoreductase